jgi:MoxR-like ATPase
MTMDPKQVERACQEFRDRFNRLQSEIGKIVVGHQDLVENTLTALFCGGHVLLEGVPGLGKTLLVRTLGQVLSLKFSRIQFTPDLMPADIIGTSIVMEDRANGRRFFEFQRGPLFAQIILADEINRATPKTQSALLEAMQEHSITVGTNTYRLEEPFLVLATQNPIEQEGTYPLPEAQLDRFFFKLLVNYSQREDLAEILNRTTTGTQPDVQTVLDSEKILESQTLVRQVAIAPHISDYAIRLVLATHPKGEFAIDQTNRFVRWGASPRAAQALVLAAKVRALRDGRYHVSFKDIADIYLPALRHRIVLNFEGEAEGLTPDDILKQILEQVPTQTEMAASK